MLRKTIIGLMALLAAIALALAGGSVASAATPGNSAPPTSNAAKPAAGKYCLSQAAPVSPGSRDLTITSTTCSDTARAGTTLPDNVAQPAATQLLVIFHQNLNYGGAYDTIAGSFGPCDSAGYGFTNLSNVEFNVGGISSYEYAAGSNCNYASYYTGTNYGGTARIGYIGNNPYVGSPWNDDIFSMHIAS